MFILWHRHHYLPATCFLSNSLTRMLPRHTYAMPSVRHRYENKKPERVLSSLHIFGFRGSCALDWDCLSLNISYIPHAQVKLLEAVILTITLISALMTGSWMLNNLGTPTRFETPKDSLRQE